jgi:hypothetical protein
MARQFNTETLSLLRRTGEVRIETASDTGDVHSTIIWVVVDERGRVLIRSYNGPSARWYREALSRSSVVIDANGRRIQATAVVATDDDRIAAASQGFRQKYPDDPATPAMVADAILSTTLELVPR